ncbi:hypothetical protein H7X87_00105 [Acetobacteraceae bacterium]|nr:hypothetical protein [Candidatus Parcubacteria bacterium]
MEQQLELPLGLPPRVVAPARSISVVARELGDALGDVLDSPLRIVEYLEQLRTEPADELSIDNSRHDQEEDETMRDALTATLKYTFAALVGVILWVGVVTPSWHTSDLCVRGLRCFIWDKPMVTVAAPVAADPTATASDTTVLVAPPTQPVGAMVPGGSVTIMTVGGGLAIPTKPLIDVLAPVVHQGDENTYTAATKYTDQKVGSIYLDVSCAGEQMQWYIDHPGDPGPAPDSVCPPPPAPAVVPAPATTDVPNS